MEVRQNIVLKGVVLVDDGSDEIAYKAATLSSLGIPVSFAYFSQAGVSKHTAAILPFHFAVAMEEKRKFRE